MVSDPILILSQTEFFQNLDSANRKRLADICLSKTLEKKEHLFLEGDKGHALYICARGSIQLYKTSSEGQDVVIKQVKPGELFGKVILFDDLLFAGVQSALDHVQQFPCVARPIIALKGFFKLRSECGFPFRWVS